MPPFRGEVFQPGQWQWQRSCSAVVRQSSERVFCGLAESGLQQ
jgi:hypothetical protein